MPENWEAVSVFLDCSTQWRHAGLAGVPVGLDYAGVRAALALSRRRPSATLFPKLRLIEAGAIAAFAEASGRD